MWQVKAKNRNAQSLMNGILLGFLPSWSLNINHNVEGQNKRVFSKVVLNSEMESRTVVARGDGELVFDGSRVSAGEDEKVLEMDGGDGGTTLRIYLTPLNCALKSG